MSLVAIILAVLGVGVIAVAVSLIIVALLIDKKRRDDRVK